jgi:hypothetical protein
MAINRSNIAKELLPGLNAIFGVEYGDVNDEQLSLFDVENSDRSFEEEVLFTGFGSAPTKSEGSAVQFDTAQESYTARYNHETVALAFSVTEEAMEDNLYDTFSKVRSRGLARAMANTKQVKAADIFNNGFAAGDFAIGDGEAFFSAAHPTIAAGTQSNLAAAADLSEAAMETILTNIQLIQDDRGILIGAGAKSLHIPPALQFTAEKILMSPGTTTGAFAKNDINAIRSMGAVPGGYFVNRRFTDTNGYFVKTDVPNGAKMFVRTPLQTKMEEDFDTGNLRFKARERYSFGVSDWRGYFGSGGA